jgi:hypothetical protein
MRNVLGVSSFATAFRSESDARTHRTPKALPAHRRAGSAKSMEEAPVSLRNPVFFLSLCLKSRNVIGRAFANNADDILRRARTSVLVRFALPPAD